MENQFNHVLEVTYPDGETSELHLSEKDAKTIWRFIKHHCKDISVENYRVPVIGVAKALELIDEKQSRALEERVHGK